MRPAVRHIINSDVVFGTHSGLRQAKYEGGIVLGVQAARLATLDQVMSRGFEIGYLGVLE